MDQDREQKIRERAHSLWEEAGRPDGRDLEFWYHAEREIGGATGATGLDESAAPWRDPAEADDRPGGDDEPVANGSGQQQASSANPSETKSGASRTRATTR